MTSVGPLPEQVVSDKAELASIGHRILDHYQQEATIEGIGATIDRWKTDHEVPEGQMIDSLGFLFGDMIVAAHGGAWVWVKDQFGEVPAVQRQEGEGILYVLDAVSKRLRDSSVAARELPSLADVYRDGIPG